MLGALKKQSPIEPVLFRDALKFRDNGYAPVMCAFGQDQPAGPYLRYVLHEAHIAMFPHGQGDQMVSILTAQQAEWAGAVSRNTYLAALRVQTTDKALARDIDAIVAKYLTWADGVEEKLSPVRLDNGGHDTLRPFQLDAQQEPFGTIASKPYVMPKDKRDYNFEPHCVEILSAGGHFVYTSDKQERPYEWTHGGLLAVKRNNLPVLNYGIAQAMCNEIEALLTERGTRWV